MFYDNSDLRVFAKFLLSGEYNVTASQIRGDLLRIYTIFIKEQKSLKVPLKTLEDFVEYLIEFNEISGSALLWSPPLTNDILKDVSYLKGPKLITFNKTKLEYVCNVEKKTKDAQMVKFASSNIDKDLDNSSKLVSLLSGPVHTTLQIEVPESKLVSEYHQDYQMLEDLLKKPTAQQDLVKARAKLMTIKKPFFEICTDSNHVNKLSNVINKNGNSKPLIKVNSSETNARLHKMIQDSRNLISLEVFKCSHNKIHYLPIYGYHTDPSLGDCSYLDTCHKLKTCRYLHYYTLSPTSKNNSPGPKKLGVSTKERISFEYTIGDCFNEFNKPQVPAQWINCDVRYLPLSILGKFAAIISDPAWNIHMNLPYGTCKDHELLELPVQQLQDEGIMLLWVTGRSIEIGRRALIKWGYKVSNEMIWIKLNQLKRTIVTGRTGHWLNHSKEHLLVGVKGNPPWLNKMVDMDIIVSATRETLRKPDEVYEIVERVVGKHARKLEMFGRDHNVRPGWMSTYTSFALLPPYTNDCFSHWEPVNRNLTT